MKHETTTVLDSCALIDGRILSVVQLGFLTGKIVIPQFIISELRIVADSKNEEKRLRAIKGLETVEAFLASLPEIARMDSRDFAGELLVDDKIMCLAQTTQASVCTMDQELIARCRAHAVPVRNLHALVLALRPVILPGDMFVLKLIRNGDNPGQAVGYTADGTLVVVGNARKFVGHTVKVVCKQMHQTEAGKMLFASLVSVSASSKSYLL